jgi:PAS domain S-box-containing protein
MWIFEMSSLRVVKVNGAAIDKYGYPENEFLVMSISDLHPHEDRQKFHSYLNHTGINGPLVTRETNNGIIWTHVGKNGELIFAEITSHPVNFKNTDCRVAVATDATEKMLFREEAIRTKNSLEALINNTEDLIWSVDRATRYVYMNKAYRSLITRITGLEPKEGEYSYLHKGYTVDEVEKWNKYYQRALAGERYSIISESTDLLTKELLSFEISFNPIYKTEGEITGVGCFSRNITERLTIEKAIIEQNERLRQIASLSSHELRRPVASMIGLINIMDRSNFFNPDNKEVIEHLLTVGNEIDEVIRLIIDKTFVDIPSNNKYQSP